MTHGIPALFLAALPALLPVLLPAASLADCPVAADLEGGIVLTGLHGEREVFTRGADGMVAASYSTAEGYASDATLAHGVFLIELVDLVGTEAETRTSYEFPLDLDALELPKAGGEWDVTVSVSDGTHNVFERQLYTYGAAEEHSYGACSYEVIPFTAEYSTAPEVVETYHYLPALGLSYLYGYDDPTGTATYPYAEIATLP